MTCSRLCGSKARTSGCLALGSRWRTGGPCSWMFLGQSWSHDLSTLIVGPFPGWYCSPHLLLCHHELIMAFYHDASVSAWEAEEGGLHVQDQCWQLSRIPLQKHINKQTIAKLCSRLKFTNLTVNGEKKELRQEYTIYYYLCKISKAGKSHSWS